MTSLTILLIGRVHTHWPIIILLLHSVTRYLLLITRSHTASGSAIQEQMDWRIKQGLMVSQSRCCSCWRLVGSWRTCLHSVSLTQVTSWCCLSEQGLCVSPREHLPGGCFHKELPCLECFCFCLCSCLWTWPGHRLCLVLVYCTCFHI